MRSTHPSPNQRPFCHHGNFSSPSIERADRAAYAEGVVPPLPRRARAVPETEAGQGVQGAWGCPSPGPLRSPRRRTSPDAGQRPFIERQPSASRGLSPGAAPILTPAATADLFYIAFPPGRWHTAAMSIFTTSTPVIGTPENGDWPLVHPLACLPEPALESPTQGNIPDDAACMALWDKYGMLDNIRAHSRMVAHIATELAQRARAAGFPVNVAAVRASAMLHDIAKTYSVLHGGSHAQLGASWVVAETRNHALAQGVLLHVHWPWAVPEQEPERLFSIPFFVIYADKRVKHDQCVPLRQRYEDLLVRYGHTEKARKGIRLSWQQGECIERAFEAHLGYAIHEDSFDSGRLVQRA